MNFYHQLLASGLLAGAATDAHAQTAPPLPPLRATLDTVAVTGTSRVLTLATAPGPDVPGRSHWPQIRTAVFYTPPAGPQKKPRRGRGFCFLKMLRVYLPPSTRSMVSPISAGESTTWMPHSRMIAILAAAVSSAPPTMAPA